jgi:hypothetical protein
VQIPDFPAADFNNLDFLTSAAMTVTRSYLFGDVPVLGPIGVAVTGISNNFPVVALGTDPVRHGILFHNPNLSGILRVFPTGPLLAAGQGGIPIEPLAFFELYASGGGNTTEENALIRCECAWQVIADVPGPLGLTIWNFTDNNPAAAAPTPVAYQNMDIDNTGPNSVNATTLTTASSQLLAANQNRRGLLLGNPGGTYYKAFSPGNIAASIGAGSIILTPQTSKLIKAFGKVRINCAINATTQNNADGTATALEFI